MRNELQKLKSAESLRQYRKTPKGKATTMWNAILWRLKYEPSYKGVQLKIPRDEFLEWVIPQLETWCISNSIESASLDRIDNDGHYEFPNLQLLSRKENNLKRKWYKTRLAPKNTNWCGACQQYLPVVNFSNCKSNSNGLKNRCKECDKLNWQKYSANLKIRELV